MANLLNKEQQKELHDLLTSTDSGELKTKLIELSEAHADIAHLLHHYLVAEEEEEVDSTSEDGSDDSEVEIVAVKSSGNLAIGKRSPINISDIVDEQNDSVKRAKTQSSDTGHRATCTQCSKLFSLDKNKEGDCVYHSGYLEADDDRIYDPNNQDFELDEETFGPFDTDDSREEWPEYFIWNCCDKDGTAPCCRRGKHNSIGKPIHYAELKHGRFSH